MESLFKELILFLVVVIWVWFIDLGVFCILFRCFYLMSIYFCLYYFLCFWNYLGLLGKDFLVLMRMLFDILGRDWNVINGIIGLFNELSVMEDVS